MATENNCACVDCRFNDDQVCGAPAIELTYGQDGKSCECTTYEPMEQQRGSVPPGLGAPRGY
jgi:hypothetical protein